MPDFIRPAKNAVTSLEELTLGTKLWHVFGICMPSVSPNEYAVIRAPIRFKDHPEYKDYHGSSLGESFVFDTIVSSQFFPEGRPYMRFASDGNINGHHNDNYWFKSKEAAETYCAQCREDWENHPEEIERVRQQREIDAMMDEYDDSHYDDFENFSHVDDDNDDA